MSVNENTIRNFNPSNFFGLSKDYFDSKGDLRYCNTDPLILERGDWVYNTPHKGWIRYGLNVEKFGNSGSNWLGHTGEPGEWAVAFHGLRRDVIESVKGIAAEGFHVYTGKNSQWGSTFEDDGPNKTLFKDKNCGIGVFCSPKLYYLMTNCEYCCLLKPIEYDTNAYIQVAIQCRVRPNSIRVPKCSYGEYYIINKTADIRPYGLLIKFLTCSEGAKILMEHNFNLDPITRFVTFPNTSDIK